MSTPTPEPAKPVVPTPPAPPAPPQPPAPPAPRSQDAATTDGASPAAADAGEPPVEVPVEPKTLLDLRHERLTGKIIKFEQNVSGVVKTDLFGEELVFKHDRIMAEFQTHDFAADEAVEFDVHTDDRGEAIAVALKPMLNRKPNECLGQRHRGYVRRFAERWGFLDSAAFDGDLFVHRDNLLPDPDQVMGEPPLRTGQVVEFDVALDDRGRAVAKQITTRALMRPADWIGHRLRGHIRSFQGAWGFINSDRFAGDLFVHQDSLLAQYQGASLHVGIMVEFDVVWDHHRKGTKNRLVARHVAILGGGEPSVPPPPAAYAHAHPPPSPYPGGLPPYQHQPSPYDYAAYAASQPSAYQPQAYGAPPPSMYYGAPDPSWAAYGYAPPQYPYPQPAPYPQPSPYAQAGFGQPPYPQAAHYPQPSPYAHPAYAQPSYPQAAPSPYAPQPYPHPYPQPASPVQHCPQPLPSPYGAMLSGSNTPAPYPLQDVAAAPPQPQPAAAAPGGAVPVSADGPSQGLLHIVMLDWEPDQPGQLFVAKGALVNVSHRAAHGWVYAGTVQPGGQSEPVTEGWVPQAVVKRVSLCRVILDWPPEGSGTLGVSKGEVIAVSKEAERGWVYGERIGSRQPDRPVDGWLPKKILDYLQS